MIGVVNHLGCAAPRSSLVQCHVERVEHELGPEVCRHGPADDPTTERIEHCREIQKACPRRHVHDVGDPELVRCARGEFALYEIVRNDIGCFSLRGVHAVQATTTVNADYPDLPHQPGDTLPAHTFTCVAQIFPDSRRTIRAVRTLMTRAHLWNEHCVPLCPAVYALTAAFPSMRRNHCGRPRVRGTSSRPETGPGDLS